MSDAARRLQSIEEAVDSFLEDHGVPVSETLTDTSLPLEDRFRVLLKVHNRLVWVVNDHIRGPKKR